MVGTAHPPEDPFPITNAIVYHRYSLQQTALACSARPYSGDPKLNSTARRSEAEPPLPAAHMDTRGDTPNSAASDATHVHDMCCCSYHIPVASASTTAGAAGVPLLPPLLPALLPLPALLLTFARLLVLAEVSACSCSCGGAHTLMSPLFVCGPDTITELFAAVGMPQDNTVPTACWAPFHMSLPVAASNFFAAAAAAVVRSCRWNHHFNIWLTFWASSVSSAINKAGACLHQRVGTPGAICIPLGMNDARV